ncbi:hypothetical protein JB92DRAFT_2690136, partial [Gautieria morchelliformis]
GDAQCCNTVGAANSLPGVDLITGLLGIVIHDRSVVIGIGCVPIRVNGVGGGVTDCFQPLCCNKNSHGVVSPYS